jgi:hypothetical protein
MEKRELYGEIVLPYWQAADAVNPTDPAGGLPRETSVNRDDLDFRTGNARPARVRHLSVEVGPVDLRCAAGVP